MFSSQVGGWYFRLGCQSQSLHVSVPWLQLHWGVSSRPDQPASGLTVVHRCQCGGERSSLCSCSGGLLCHSLIKPWWSHATVSHPEQVSVPLEPQQTVCGVSWKWERVNCKVMCNGPLNPLCQVFRWPTTGVSDRERLIPAGSFLCPVLPAPEWIQRRLPSLQPQPV